MTWMRNCRGQVPVLGLNSDAIAESWSQGIPLASCPCPLPCVALITSWEPTDLGFCLQPGPCTLTTALHRLKWDTSPHWYASHTWTEALAEIRPRYPFPSQCAGFTCGRQHTAHPSQLVHLITHTHIHTHLHSYTHFSMHFEFLSSRCTFIIIIIIPTFITLWSRNMAFSFLHLLCAKRHVRC